MIENIIQTPHGMFSTIDDILLLGQVDSLDGGFIDVYMMLN